MTRDRHFSKTLLLVASTSLLWLTACDSVISILGGDEYEDTTYPSRAVDTVICGMYGDTSNFLTVRPPAEYDLEQTWNTSFLLPDENWVVYRDTQWVDPGADTVTVHPSEDWIILPDTTWQFPYDSVLTMGRDTIVLPADQWDLFNDPAQLNTEKNRLIQEMLVTVYDSIAADSLYGAHDSLNLVISSPETQDNVLLLSVPETGIYVVAVDNYVKIGVYTSSGTQIAPESEMIPLDAINGCYTTKTRRQFSLTANTEYMFQLAKTDQTAHIGNQDTLSLIVLQDIY